MSNSKIVALALAGTALATAPAQAGGLLGGGAGNCLCQVIDGLASGGSTSIDRAPRGARQPGVVSRGARGKAIANRSITGSVSSSVNSALAVTVGRSFERRGGRPSANTGLAGKVTGTVNAAPSSAHHAGQVATGRSLANIAVLNGNGGTSGKVANVSVLNKSGTTGRSLANVAILNGRGGTSGKIVNVAMLNKSNTNGRSLANVSVLNGGHGNGHGGLRLPNGVQIINGVPCGPDGTPLIGAAATTVMAMISSKGGHGGSSGNGPGSSNHGSNGGNGSPGVSNRGSQNGSQGGQPTPTGQHQERLDRTDLWWPQHTEGSYRDGRLNDH